MAMAAKTADLQKRTVDSLDALTKELTKIATANSAMAARLEKLESQPAPAKGVLKVIEKGQDKSPAEKKDDVDLSKASATDLIKVAFTKPLAQLG